MPCSKINIEIIIQVILMKLTSLSKYKLGINLSFEFLFINLNIFKTNGERNKFKKIYFIAI